MAEFKTPNVCDNGSLSIVVALLFLNTMGILEPQLKFKGLG
jgi:hypothetical protein